MYNCPDDVFYKTNWYNQKIHQFGKKITLDYINGIFTEIINILIIFILTFIELNYTNVDINLLSQSFVMQHF